MPMSDRYTFIRLGVGEPYSWLFSVGVNTSLTDLGRRTGVVGRGFSDLFGCFVRDGCCEGLRSIGVNLAVVFCLGPYLQGGIVAMEGIGAVVCVPASFSVGQVKG